MKKALLVALSIFFLNILLTPLFAQADDNRIEPEPLRIDTFLIGGEVVPAEKDTLTDAEIKSLNKKLNLKLVDNFQPNPTKAVIYSAIFPGLGQMYNRKYWKLPIVYGGFLGVIYAVTWNGNMYTDYRRAYIDLMVNPYGTDSWHPFTSDPSKIVKGTSEYQWLTSLLKRRRDYFRRNRDLAIIVGVGLYVLCMVDAYVDAHLYNFTVTPDLSMTIAPVVWGPSNISASASVGIQCNIVF